MKKRNLFNLSHYKLLSCNMGNLIPISVMEVLPGDTFNHSTSALVRLSPQLAPVMHPVHVSIHHWYVPTRLVWDDFENFITGGPDGNNSSVHPLITFGGGSGAAEGSLADYLGVTPGVNNLAVSALPFRAYDLIWNEHYRDEDLQTELVISRASGPDTTTSTLLQNRSWEKDYFTSARPWQQKGPAVSLPLAGNAPVTATGAQPQFKKNAVDIGIAVKSSTDDNLYLPSAGGADGAVAWGTTTGLQADLSSVTAATISDLRRASAIQRFEEMRSRFGSRYSEYLRAWGVRSSDGRLQRPEYLGGGRQTIQFSEVLQTAEGTDPVGSLKGHGIGAMRSNKYRRYFEEHGYVISLISVQPKTMYAQGINRLWNRPTKYDFYTPELAHIGQQAIYNREVYAAHTTPAGVFGYQDRYDEYRRMPSSIAGEFRSTLDFWHMARIFGTSPALNADFVKANPTDRIFAVPSEDTLWIMANHNVKALRGVARRADGRLV
nr:MAG: major capsid protein [Microvirus sp.]